MGTATAEDVRLITGSTLSDTELQPFLSVASCVIDSIAACTTAKGVSQDCLTQAEAWLASHALSLSPLGASAGTVKKEKFEGYSIDRGISQSTGQGVMATNYGETANLLTLGCLQDADKAPALICSFG